MRRAFFAASVLLLSTSCADIAKSLQPIDGGPEPVGQRLDRVESQAAENARLLDNMQALELATELQQIREELRELRGMVELAGHTASTSAERQRKLFVDLDRRVQALESGRSGTTPNPAAGTDGRVQPPVADDRKIEAAYLAAFDVLKQGDYKAAVSAFDKFLGTYPDSQYAANAHYWMGESQYVQENYDGAIDAFEKVVNDYPKSAKVPDALLKLGFVQYEKKQFATARSTFESLVERFPDTSAAKLAGQRLERMKREGV